MNLAVFDIDGTLVVPYEIEDECYLDTLRSVFGFDGVDPDWTGYSDVTDSGLLHELCIRWRGHPPAKEELTRFQTMYCAEFVKRCGSTDGPAIPGASSFLRELRGRSDWRVAVATGNFHTLAIHKLQQGGMPCLDVPMATADDGISRSTLVRLAVSKSEVEYGIDTFDHVVSIGDAPWDLHTAKELDLPFVAVGERCGSRPGGTIMDYLDGPGVLGTIENAVCW